MPDKSSLKAEKSLQVMSYGSFTTIFNAKGSGLRKRNLGSRTPKAELYGRKVMLHEREPPELFILSF